MDVWYLAGAVALAAVSILMVAGCARLKSLK
jgi:hypothetical protein